MAIRGALRHEGLFAINVQFLRCPSAKLRRRFRGQMKFVADAMLGKLAKWLRMLGYDTCYIADVDDDELVRISVREDRILLTRDRRLCERRMVRARCFFVDWGTTAQQIRQVMSGLGLEFSRESLFTRCAVCNSEIVPVEKNTIRDRVPPFVFATQDEFGYCAHCDKIYWRGTHVQHVLEALQEEESNNAGSN